MDSHIASSRAHVAIALPNLHGGVETSSSLSLWAGFCLEDIIIYGGAMGHEKAAFRPSLCLVTSFDLVSNRAI